MLSVLLGAGASIEAGLPSAIGLTGKIVDDARPDYKWILNFVRWSMQAHRAALRNSGEGDDVDSESLFNTVNDLVHRDTLDVAPFVLNWHPSLLSIAKESTSRLRKAIHDALEDGPFRHFREGDLAEEIVRAVKGPSIPEDLLDSMKMSAVRSLDPVKPLDYLKPLVEYAKNHGSLAVATLNYDLCVEKCCEECGVAFSDGFESFASSSLAFPDSGLQLYKLHGSVSWQATEAASGVRRVTNGPERGFNPEILFGGRNKLTARFPFFELLWQWRERLEQTDELWTVGYSFRDDHVNAIIDRWIRRDRRRKMTIVDPRPRDIDDHPFQDLILRDSNESSSHFVEDVNEPLGRRFMGGPPPSPTICIMRCGAGEALRQLV